MDNITMDPPKKRKIEIIPTSDYVEMEVPPTPVTEYRLQRFTIIKHQLKDEREKRAKKKKKCKRCVNVLDGIDTALVTIRQ